MRVAPPEYGHCVPDRVLQVVMVVPGGIRGGPLCTSVLKETGDMLLPIVPPGIASCVIGGETIELLSA